MGMSLALGSGFWARALAGPATPGPSPYGPLRTEADANGLLLPEGFTSRVVARSLQPVPGTTYPWPVFPDGGACFATDDGGWIYVSNSENPPPALDLPLPLGREDVFNDVLLGQGGVSAIRFDADGVVVEAYPILTTGRSNCAGGVTPWGTWLSCEEWEAPEGDGLAPATGGRVWECDPFARTAVERPAMGLCKHEAAAVDPERQHLYLSEDLGDGLLYRFTPTSWGDLSSGTLEAMVVDDSGATTWVTVPEPTAGAAGSLRSQVPEATPFDGGEGCVYDSGKVYLATKGDDRIWVHDIEAETMSVLYDAALFDEPVLTGVDNVIVSEAHDLYIAEDGGTMQVVVITPDHVVAPVAQIVDPTSTGYDNGTPIPTSSEVTGLAFSPDGNRLYLNSQRGGVFGILYEVTGPFRGGSLAAAQPEPPARTTSAPAAPATTLVPVDRPAAAPTSGPATLPATGPDLPATWLAAGAAGAGLLAWRARDRSSAS